MATVNIKKQYSDIIGALGNLQETVDEALRKYAVEKATERILELRSKVQAWENKYGCSYELFAYRTATDEEYVNQLNASPQTAMWEGDMIAWEFYALELEEWYRRLQNISTE